jgi:hypothetical protein
VIDAHYEQCRVLSQNETPEMQNTKGGNWLTEVVLTTAMATFSHAAALITVGAAHAQTQLHEQSVDMTDYCEGRDVSKMDTADIWACATNNSDNHQASVKSYLTCAEHGDWDCQYSLGDIYDHAWPYDNGEGYPPRDVVKSYEWFEISAAVKGQYVDALPPGASEMAETNRGEISRRDDEAAKMSATQIEAAQRQAREWLRIHADTITRYVHSDFVQPH